MQVERRILNRDVNSKQAVPLKVIKSHRVSISPSEMKAKNYLRKDSSAKSLTTTSHSPMAGAI